MNEIDLTDGNTKGRHVQPQGFVPSNLAAPALRDQYATQLEYVAYGLGEIGALAQTTAEDEGAGIADRAAAMMIQDEAAGLRRLIKAIATGALVALVAVGLSVGGARPASAAEAPQPDPVASGITYRVTLDRPIVTLAVPFVTTRPVPGTTLHCGSLWLAGSPVGYGCSIHRAFTVTARLDAAAVPVGRSALELVDEATGASVTATLQARRPSRFGVGTYLDSGNGDLLVSASLYAYTPAKGAWTPQHLSPVQVLESTRRGWRLRATLTTNSAGRATGIVHLGGGLHYIRLVRPVGGTVMGTQGQVRLVDVTEVPFDIV